MRHMTESGIGDPELVAGTISKAIVTQGLASLLFIPILMAVYFVLKRRRKRFV